MTTILTCEYCKYEASSSDWGDTGDMNGNLPICPQCGAWDAVGEEREVEEEDE